MRKILLSALIVAILSAGWCPSAEAGPLRKAKAVGGKVIHGVGKVLKRAAHPFKGC